MARVSIIIPVRNDQPRLDACLQALERQTYPAADLEIIVVDNGSSPPIRVADERVRLIVEHRPGSYAARNAGAHIATGEVLAFTDADCLPQPTWLEEGVARLLREPQCGLVAGAVEVFCRDPDAPTLAELYELSRGFPQRRYVELDHFGATANVFIARDVLSRLGGFDPILLSGGDLDLGRRAHAAGLRIVYAPEAVVRHPARRSMKNLLTKVIRTEVGMRQLARARGHGQAKVARSSGCHRYDWYRRPARMVVSACELWLRHADLDTRQRLRVFAATLTVELVRSSARRLLELGLPPPDLRRFWGV